MKLPIHAPVFNEDTLPLFAWSRRMRWTTLPWPAQRIAHRFGVTPTHATLIAGELFRGRE
jgi:hypothetical protein